MSPRRTLVAALVAACLAAYIYWVEQPRIDAEQAAGRLLVFEPDRIDRVQLRYPSSPTLVAERTEDGWQLLEPRRAPADAGTIGLLLEAIRNTEVERGIESGAHEDLSTYGLEGDGDHARISLRLDDGTNLPDIIVGRTTPVGYQAFVRVVGRDELLVTPLLFHSGVKKTPYDLRSKIVFEIEPDGVSALTVTRTGTGHRVERSTGGWTIKGAHAGRADSQTVSTMIGSLNAITALAFYDGDDVGRAGFGLEPPAAVFEIELADGTRDGMKIGALDHEASAGCYLERLSDGQVFKGPDWVRSRYDIDVSALRDRHLFTCTVDEVVRLEFDRSDGAGFILERATDGAWKSPDETDAKLNQRLTQRAVEGLVELAGESVILDAAPANYGLDNPDLKLSVSTADGASCGVALATRAPGGAGYYIAALQTSLVMTLPEYLFSRLDVRLADLIDENG